MQEQGIFDKEIWKQLINDRIAPKYIDLSLPSGILWADRNVGAENERWRGIYCNIKSPEYERNALNIPTIDMYEELCCHCEHNIIFNKGKQGIRFKSKYNGNTIFFPFEGYRDAVKQILLGEDSIGFYLTSSSGTVNFCLHNYFMFTHKGVFTKNIIMDGVDVAAQVRLVKIPNK